MDRSEVRRRVMVLREERMWTQRRLAKEAGVSPTTVSGIEGGKISRPHFGTVRKLARALGVGPKELLSASGPVSEPGLDEGAAASLSLAWAKSSREEEFEKGLEGATLGGLLALSRALGREHEHLRRLYGEAKGVEERRLVKERIRGVAAQQGSVEASISYHPDLQIALGEHGE